MTNIPWLQNWMIVSCWICKDSVKSGLSSKPLHVQNVDGWGRNHRFRRLASIWHRSAGGMPCLLPVSRINAHIQTALVQRRKVSTAARPALPPALAKRHQVRQLRAGADAITQSAGLHARLKWHYLAGPAVACVEAYA